MALTLDSGKAGDSAAALQTLRKCMKGAGAEQIREHYEARVKDKKLQVLNPDRPRPRPDPQSIASVKLSARDKKSRSSLRTAHTRLQQKKGSPTRRNGRAEGRRSRGVEGLDEDLSYAALLPLHEFWTSYIQQFLSLVRVVNDEGKGTTAAIPNVSVLKAANATGATWTIGGTSIASIQQQACKADLVGGAIEITQASNPTLVGVGGIVAKETEHTFVVAQDHSTSLKSVSGKTGRQFKVIPKRNTVLLLKVALPRRDDTQSSLQQLELPLHGNQMEGALTSRATRKWKQRKTLEFN
ncbi:unnamed protein product [Parajaminaea phylloscopi]